MLRTAKLLPPTGLSTLGFDPARFQTKPPACYRASWQLLGRDSHPLATTSLCWNHLINKPLQLRAHCSTLASVDCPFGLHASAYPRHATPLHPPGNPEGSASLLPRPGAVARSATVSLRPR